jgi:hypothetical protein
MSFFIHVDEEQNKAHISITLVVFSVWRSGWLNDLILPGFVNYQKVCTRLATASDKV